MSIIGLDIGGTNMTAGLVSQNKLKKVVSQKTAARGTLQEIIRQITDLLDGLVKKNVKGIGIGVPGLVDEKGMAYEAVNIPAWNKVRIKKILEPRYHLPVYVNNDANCFALGEKYFGKAKKYNNIAAVTIGTGMGTGLIIEGKLYNGSTGGAGEFGQIGYLDGIMEDYSSGQFFKRKYRMKGDELYEKALKKDKKALRAFREYGHHLGQALSMITYAVDPEVIILGGSISQAFRFFEKSMKESLRESSYERTYGRLKIAVSDKPNMGVMGAAALAFNN